MRDQIRAEMVSIQPLDETEERQIAESLAWVDSGSELCRLAKPAIPPKHLVSYFVLIDGQHLLLADHKDARLWLPTGGHVEPGEHPRMAVRRELQEELGIAVDGPVAAPLMITVTTTGGLSAGHTDVSLWYVIHHDRRRDLHFDTAEFNHVGWFNFSEVPFDRTDPHLVRFLRKLAAYPSSSQRNETPGSSGSQGG